MSSNGQKASLGLLEELHSLIAKAMLEKLKMGECEAKDWAVIVKFLKDNGIDMAVDTSQDASDNFAQIIQAAQKSLQLMQTH